MQSSRQRGLGRLLAHSSGGADHVCQGRSKMHPFAPVERLLPIEREMKRAPPKRVLPGRRSRSGLGPVRPESSVSRPCGDGRVRGRDAGSRCLAPSPRPAWAARSALRASASRCAWPAARRGPRDVDLQRPVDRALRRHWAEAHEVRKHRQRAEARVDLVTVMDLGVTVAVAQSRPLGMRVIWSARFIGWSSASARAVGPVHGALGRPPGTLTYVRTMSQPNALRAGPWRHG
jgi:hypothetical protein